MADWLPSNGWYPGIILWVQLSGGKSMPPDSCIASCSTCTCLIPLADSTTVWRLSGLHKSIGKVLAAAIVRGQLASVAESLS